MKKVFVFLLAIAISQTVIADEISDAISAALESYNAGETSAAIEKLDFAANKLKQIKSESITKLLPDPMESWSIVENNSDSHMASAFGGMVMAGKDYIKGQSKVSIIVITDSPMVQSTAMMFANPMMVKLSGDKVIDINGKKAILHYMQGNGKISILLDEKILISVDGSNVKQEDLEKYAAGVNFEELLKLQQGL